MSQLYNDGRKLLVLGSLSGGAQVTAGAVIADNAIVRGDGGGRGVQSSGVTIDDTGHIAAVVGSAAAPSYTFAGLTTDGFYSSSSGNINVTLGGSDTFSLQRNAGSPRFSTLGGTGARLDFSSAGALGATAGGTNQSITLTPSGTGAVVVPNGLVATPGIAFTSAGGALGIWASGNSIRFTTTGALALSLSAGGGAAGPDIAFGAAGTTGIFNVSTSGIGFSIAGTEKARLAPTTGNLLLGGLTTDGSNGRIQLDGTTGTAGGIAFNSSSLLNILSSGQFAFNNTGGDSIIALQASSATVGQIKTSGTNLVLATGSTAALTLDNTQNTQLAKLISSYNGIATAGNGVATIQAAGRSVAQTGALATIGTAYTVGASDASFLVSANINVTTATTHSFSVTCTYTDETNTSRTATLGFVQLSGATFITVITNVTGAGPYESQPLHIRCKASTAITFATTGTFTTVTYNAEAAVVKLA